MTGPIHSLAHVLDKRLRVWTSGISINCAVVVEGALGGLRPPSPISALTWIMFYDDEELVHCRNLKPQYAF